MIKAQPTIDSSSYLRLRLQPAIDLTDDQFFKFCQLNRDLRIERTSKGDLIIMPPTDGETGHRNIELATDLNVWARQNQTGVAFDSSTGFILPNGATRSPDASWVLRSRLLALTPQEKRKFLPLCPDFVIELRSPSDSVIDLQEKMQEYIDNGTQLGWLIDPEQRRVYVYRPDESSEFLDEPETISGDPVLTGFVLGLQRIWQPDF